jgi:hypothetical protein
MFDKQAFAKDTRDGKNKQDQFTQIKEDKGR